MGIFPVDIPDLLREIIDAEAKEPDGLLHASSLTEPLRHTQLRLSGAPEYPRSFTNDVTLMTGTLWHRFLESSMKTALHTSNSPFLSEVNVTIGMPEGWGGTADWLIWDIERRAFVLGDLKTIKGAGLPWVLRDGAKVEHIWQLSSYWYALRNMGIPLVEGFGILYLPKDEVAGKDLQATVMECNMIDELELLDVMTKKKQAVDEFLERKQEFKHEWHKALAPIPDRTLHKVWNKKTQVHDVVLKPHYSSAYCRFIDCGCNELGQTKVGHVEDDHYISRKGYEKYECSYEEAFGRT